VLNFTLKYAREVQWTIFRPVDQSANASNLLMEYAGKGYPELIKSPPTAASLSSRAIKKERVCLVGGMYKFVTAGNWDGGEYTLTIPYQTREMGDLLGPIPVFDEPTSWNFMPSNPIVDDSKRQMQAQ